MTAAEILVQLSDVDALALTIHGEASSEPVEGRVAVACVVRNRLAKPKRFGWTYRSVCHQRGQFSCWSAIGGGKNYRRVMLLAASLVQGDNMPITGAELAAFQEALYIARGVVLGVILDRAHGATHYYAPAQMKPKGSIPGWAQGQTPITTAGSHVFFAGIA